MHTVCQNKRLKKIGKTLNSRTIIFEQTQRKANIITFSFFVIGII